LRLQVQGTVALDHGRPRSGSYRWSARPDQIDLGDEPPLSVDGGSNSLIDRRRISVQWFSGTILTGLCGAALMAGAVFASLDGETNFASVPEQAESALRGALGFGERLASVARKADRLPPPSEASFARQVIRVSTTSRVGNRQVVRVRPFVRIVGNLSMTVSDLSASIPPFNPQRMLAEAAPGGTTATSDAAEAAAPDAEVSFVVRDLAPLLPKAKLAARLPLDEVITQVRDTAQWTGSGSKPTAVASLQPGFKLAYATEGDRDPYAGFEARIVPENITLLPKTTSPTASGNGTNERTITVKKGDSVASILRDLGATAEEIKQIAAVLGRYGRDNGLKEGQRLRILLSPTSASPKLHPVRVIVLGDQAAEAVAALSDMGKYVAVDIHNIDTAVTAAKQDEEDDGTTGVRLYRSIWETALRNRVSKPVIEDMIRIFSYDVDFQRKVQAGDTFELLFAGEDDTPGDARNDVLFASLTVGGETKKYYRFQTPDDGAIDYYDESGKSAKQFLVRKPVVTGVMRSGFGMRRHPILGYSKMHTGVDWAAPHGTPIFAAGNGIVEKAQWDGGYGKFVLLRHPNGYETAYGHMTAYARGIKPGVRVRQGQVIGFVGSTGLSTGSHVHYEIRINSRFVDPMRIKLPRGRTLSGRLLASFEKERKRLDNMMQLPAIPARVAQTGSPAAARR
jgi:murein DD-endopeptidase MepM/ murein hydrolase activator NlpD